MSLLFQAKAALILFVGVSFAAVPSKFFANQDIQNQSPAAFALQPEAAFFVRSVEASTRSEKENLVAAIQSDKSLMAALSKWEHLSIQEQIPFLKRVFLIECRVLRIKPPKLVFDPNAKTGAAYFDFDPEKPGPGTVILNPKSLADLDNKFASLMFLIHETRHSAQFQLAYSKNSQPSPLASGYRHAFIAQKQIKGTSFCDFMTLLNEYEAFQFGSFVVGKLTNWNVDTTDMGTYASQYDENGELKIDLASLTERVGARKLLRVFNLLEKEQHELLKRKM